jgi:integrase
MHAWRHSTPKLLDSLGIPSASIQKWLGHTSIQQTEAYLHVEARDLRRQLDKALATQHAKEPI